MNSVSTSTLLRRSLAEGSRSASGTSNGLNGNERIAIGIYLALKDDLSSDPTKVLHLLREVESQSQLSDIEARYQRKYGSNLIADLEDDLSPMELDEIKRQCTNFTIEKDTLTGGAREYLETYINRSFGPTSVSRRQLSARIGDDAVCKSILSGQAGDEGKSAEVLGTLLSKMTNDPEKEVSHAQWSSAVRKAYTEVDTLVTPQDGFTKALQHENRLGGLNITSITQPGNSAVKSIIQTPVSIASNNKEGDPVSMILDDDCSSKTLPELADIVNVNIESALALTAPVAAPVGSVMTGGAKRSVQSLVAQLNHLRTANSELMDRYQQLQDDNATSLQKDVIFEQRIANLEADRNDLRREVDDHLLTIQARDAMIKNLEQELESQTQQCQSLKDKEEALSIHARMAEDRAREAEAERDKVLTSNDLIRQEVAAEYEPQIEACNTNISKLLLFIKSSIASLSSREAECRLAIQEHAYDTLFKIFSESRSEATTKSSEKQQYTLQQELENAKARTTDLEIQENQLQATIKALQADLQSAKQAHESALNQLASDHQHSAQQQKELLEGRIKKLSAECDQYRNENTDKSDKIRQLEQQLRVSDDKNRKEEQNNKIASETVDNLSKKLESAEDKTVELRSEVNNLLQKLAEEQAKAKQQELTNASLMQTGSESASKLEQLFQELANKNETNANLQQQLTEQASELETQLQKHREEQQSLKDKIASQQNSKQDQLREELEKELLKAQEELNRNMEMLKDADGKDAKIKQLLQTIEKQARELELLRKQLREVHGAAHVERSLRDLLRAQEDDRETIERQEIKGKKYLERYWRRIEMPFGAEGSLQIKVKGPSKADPEPAVVISEVVPGGAAAKAGVSAGGLIIRVRNPIGNWSVITRSDFLQTIGPRGHVFENVELSLFVVHDEKFIAEWRKRLLEYVKQEDRQKSSGSWLGRMRGKRAGGFSGIKLKMQAPAHLIKEYKLRMETMSEDARRNRYKHIKALGVDKFGATFNAENVFAMQSNPDQWRTLVLAACDKCNVGGSRDMIKQEQGVQIVLLLAESLGSAPPPVTVINEAFSIVDVGSRGEVDFAELTLFIRELFMDVVFRDTFTDPGDH
eukprot:TRINITY_DN16439_c0_g1_i1.p1 TRINITY_DN16439_c0_g1~~TRINITY_DN16439_c0_g1_i1.p1  ORF type:complete len:1105 (+),score=276.76 TRINITY_DN16439_c0_g1_i1:43-3357(+)